MLTEQHTFAKLDIIRGFESRWGDDIYSLETWRIVQLQTFSGRWSINICRVRVASIPLKWIQIGGSVPPVNPVITRTRVSIFGVLAEPICTHIQCYYNIECLRVCNVQCNSLNLLCSSKPTARPVSSNELPKSLCQFQTLRILSVSILVSKSASIYGNSQIYKHCRETLRFACVNYFLNIHCML